jgi:hypothetical protein
VNQREVIVRQQRLKKQQLKPDFYEILLDSSFYEISASRDSCKKFWERKEQ